ncbi:MAG: hypothetical protein QOI76_398 [Frankiales bacterium]|nr:hypothetical protein [Frankiales bacterium]
MVTTSAAGKRVLLPVAGVCVVLMAMSAGRADASAAFPAGGESLVAAAGAGLPAEITDSVVNWCTGLDPAWSGFTVGSYQRQIDVDHVTVPICDDPVGPDVLPQTNTIGFAAQNPITGVFGPLPAARSASTLDYGLAGHPVGSWSMPVVALPPSMLLSYNYTQTVCSPDGCQAGTFPRANVYYDKDPLRTRRLRVAGWPEQDAPGGRVEPLFSARCESLCSAKPISLSFSVSLIDTAATNPYAGATVIMLGPFPIALPDAVTLRFRLPVPLAVQQQVLTHIRGGATKKALFVIQSLVQQPLFQATGAIMVSQRSLFESTSYSPYQPASVSLERGDFLAAAVPAWATVGRPAAAAARESLAVRTGRLGLNARSVAVTAEGRARTARVTLSFRLETAVGGTSRHYVGVGKLVKRTVLVHKGRYHLTLAMPTPVRSGVVVRAVVKSVGRTTITRRSVASTLLRAW